MEISPTGSGNGVDGLINLLVLVCFVGYSLGGDGAISSSSHRDMFFARDEDELQEQIGLLGLLIFTRIRVRRVVRLNVFPFRA